MHHKDQFDHMILAQAKHENMTIITGDSIFKKYLPDTIVILPLKNFFCNITFCPLRILRFCDRDSRL